MKSLHTVRFDDIKPGAVFYHCFGHDINGRRILSPISTMFIKSEPYKSSCGFWMVDVEERGRLDRHCLYDMNVRPSDSEEKRYNNHFLFYTNDDAISYAANPELMIQHIVEGFPLDPVSTELEALALVRKLFEEKWGVYTNEPAWKNIKKFEDCKCLFNDFKTLTSQVFKDILTEMENEFKQKN